MSPSGARARGPAGAGIRPAARAGKGLAYLSLRLDDPLEARDALAKLRVLDPDDRVGAALLEALRQRRYRVGADGGGAEDGDDGPALPVFGAAAWARVAASGGTQTGAA